MNQDYVKKQSFICNLYAVIKIRVKKCLFDTEVLNTKE